MNIHQDPSLSLSLSSRMISQSSKTTLKVLQGQRARISNWSAMMTSLPSSSVTLTSAAARFLHLRPRGAAWNATALRFKSDKARSVQQETEAEEPVPFSSSAARRSRPAYMTEADNPPSRTASWFLSLVAFGLWFFVLREESDWDENLSVSLYERVDHLEKTNLITAINYYQRNGMNPEPLVKRLAEIEAEEAAAFAAGKKVEAELEAAAAAGQGNNAL